MTIMKNPLKSVLMALTLAGSLGASSTVMALDLLQCYQLAISNDPAWRATLSTYLADQQNEGLAFGALLPQIGASASITRQRIDPEQGNTTMNNTAKQAGLVLRQPLFRRDLWQRYQQARIGTTLNDAALEAQQQQFILKVGQAYFDALRADAVLDALYAEERAFNQQQTMMQERFKAGLIARTDWSEAQAQFQLTRAARISGEINVTNSREVLAGLIGQPVTTLSPLSENFQFIPPVPNQLAEWEQLSRSKNPSVQVARFQTDLAESNRKIQQSGHFPQLDLVGQGGWVDNSATQQKLTNGKTLSAGLELSIPLYTGGRTTLTVRQAAYQVDAAEKKWQAAQRDALVQTRLAFLGLDADRAKLSARKEAQTSGDLVAEASKAGYDLGMRTMVDVLQAQRTAYAARRDLIAAKYDYVQHLLQLKAAAGVLSAGDLTEINQWLTGHDEAIRIQPVVKKTTVKRRK